MPDKPVKHCRAYNVLSGCLNVAYHNCPFPVLCLFPNQRVFRQEHFISDLFMFSRQAVQEHCFFLGKRHQLQKRQPMFKYLHLNLIALITKLTPSSYSLLVISLHQEVCMRSSSHRVLLSMQLYIIA